MECLDEDAILGFCRGGLGRDARSKAEEHIAACDECRILVSAVARSSVVDVAEMGNDHQGDRISETAQAPFSYASRTEAADRVPAPLLRRVDPAMAPPTPVGGAGFAGPSASPVQPGEILAGKFEVERVLGAGGMGIVVAARHTQLDQRVALKFLLPVACEVPGAVARFLREGKAAARITSEHVARVMDTGVLEGGAPYLVMEYLEGSDLGELVQRRGRIPPEEAIDWVLQACEAIVEAHDLGIVHRDLKPANLFLSHRADGSPLVKVLDFGISKLEGGSRSQLTSASVLMGSPRYMSPEQMLSAKDVDARTDVWALGVILYELVSGKAVWQADTMQGLCALIASAPAPSLLVEAPDAPPILADVIAHCLVKSRDERVASVADLALALEPIAPDSARTSIERIVRVARRERAAGASPRSAPSGAPSKSPLRAGASGPAAAIAIAASATTGDRADRVDGRRAPPARVGMILAIAVAALLVAGIAINAAIARRARVEPTDLGLANTGPAVGPAIGTTPTSVAAATSTFTSPAAPAHPAASAPDPVSMIAASPAIPPPPAASARRGRNPATPVGRTAAAATAATDAPALAPPATAPVTPAHTNRALSDRK